MYFNWIFIKYFFISDTGLFFFSFSNLLNQFLIISSIIYFFGICGIIFNRRNFLITMLFIEVMYVGIFLYFISSSMYLNSPIGQIYAMVILITAACESAVGLGILLVLFKNDYTINFNNFTELRG